MRRFTRTMAVGLAVILLAACSGGLGGPAATATPEGGYRQLDPTISSAPCHRAELEEWLQRSGSLVFEYTQEVNNNLATPPDRMAEVLERIGALYSSVQDTTPPPCAVDHHAMIVDTMARALQSLTDYAEGHAVDLITFGTESNAALDRIRAREDQLAAQYNSLPRE